MVECHTDIVEAGGSIPSIPTNVIHGAVAQLVERRPEEPGVGGSIPSRTTKNFFLRIFDGFLEIKFELFVIFQNIVLFIYKRKFIWKKDLKK